jgi:ubiquinone/menaquinone biosynthesis C-methylase UbiE
MSMSDRVRRRALNGLVAERFLEIGAGSGKNFHLVDSGFKVGVDTSMRMLEHTRSRIPGVILMIADAHTLPLRDGSIDVSVFCYCLRGLARPLDALKEALRVSAQVVVIDYNKPDFIPAFLWESVINRFGRAVFGSRDLDFGSLERLGRKTQSSDLHRGLYRVIVLEGTSDAAD